MMCCKDIPGSGTAWHGPSCRSCPNRSNGRWWRLVGTVCTIITLVLFFFLLLNGNADPGMVLYER